MMASRIPDETLDAIRDRVSIVDVVSGYVSLKKAGRNHVGLCPFHSEKTASFTVSDDRGLFHCFGCGAGGTVFSFVMRVEHCDFPQAAEILARKAGVTLPPRSGSGPDDDYRQKLFQLNESAQRFFAEALGSDAGRAAREYLQTRGLLPQTIERYGLGFCARNGSRFLAAVSSKPRAIDAAVHLGILGRRDDGSHYERFRNRVTFPIRDGSGRILGFGGRTLGDDPPKYLNSPESTLFHKGRVLYGLFEARQAILEAERIVIVEGYMDALALVEAGIGGVVASLGTALTVEQLKLARRFAPQIVAFFDGDRAGRQAAERAFGVCLDARVWGLGAFLPEGVDPDSYVRSRGVDAVRGLLETVKPLADFFLERVDPGPSASVPERARAADHVRDMIGRVDDPVMFNILAKGAAQRLGIDESVFRQRRPRRPNKPSLAVRNSEDGSQAEQFRPEEITLVELMALDPHVAERVAECDLLQRFESATLADAARLLVRAWVDEGSCDAAVDQLPEVLAGRIAAGLLGGGALASDRDQIADDCIRRIEQRARVAERRSAVTRVRQLEAGGDTSELRKELERIVVLRQRDDAQQD